MVQSLTVGTAAGNKTATEIWVGTAGGNKQATEGWVGTASGNQQFYNLGNSMTPGTYSFFDISTSQQYEAAGFLTNTIPPGGYNVFGSLSPVTSSVYGTAITDLYVIDTSDNVATSGPGSMRWTVTGTQANSGWTTMTVGVTPFLRSAATFSTSGGLTSWTWPAYTTDVSLFSSNPTLITWT